MAITQQDIQPFIPYNINTPAASNDLLSYYNSLPQTGGTQTYPAPNNGVIANKLGAFGNSALAAAPMSPTGMINAFTSDDPISAMLSASSFGLFGNKKQKEPTFQPYQDANGNWMWSKNPAQNTVPVTDIPGAQQSPTGEYTQMANNVRTMQDLLPYISQYTNQANLTDALGQLGIAQATSGPYAQLQTQLFNQYGPQLNAIGNEINRRNALAQASTEGEVMSGPGANLVNQAYDLSQVFDKPYYDTRAQTSGELSKLFGSIDLSGALGAGERNEIAQGLAREQLNRGTLNAPNASETVANAMRYGNAGYQRKTQQQGILSDAIQKASMFLPTAKSGVDVFQVATGRPSMTNQGANQFTGVNSAANNQGQQQANSGLSGLNSLTASNAANQTALSINQANINANKKDWMDYLSQATSSIGNLAGAAKRLI